MSGPARQDRRGPPLTLEERARARSFVLYEDPELLALDKPSGLASQGGRGGGPTLERLLAAFARSNGKAPSLVHRLDKDTSGVILAAKTKPMAGRLGKALMKRRVRKTYLSLLERPPEPRSGSIDAALKREAIGREAYMRIADPAHPDAETALTRYRTLEASDIAALVELRPESGRMHQLRVHLAHLERPILGDGRYGGALVLAGRPVGRTMLHAFSIEVPDLQGGLRTFAAPPPADFRALAAWAGLGAGLERFAEERA